MWGHGVRRHVKRLVQQLEVGHVVTDVGLHRLVAATRFPSGIFMLMEKLSGRLTLILSSLHASLSVLLRKYHFCVHFNSFGKIARYEYNYDQKWSREHIPIV